MDLQVTQENLSKALQTVARVASGRSTLPILSNVLIQTVDNRLSISATNLDIAITQYIGSKVKQRGSLTVPARLTQDFISNLPSGTIHLEQKDHKLHIESGTYKSTINGSLADEYPVMPAITKGITWSIPAQNLKKALSQVVIAASTDEARPLLTGVYIHTHGTNLFMVATDSYRLAEKNLGNQKEELSLLVPGNALQDVLRIIGDYGEDVVVTHDDQQVLFKVGDVELVARLLEGSYPDYRRLIPQDFAMSATLPRSEFINIVKISSLFARESAGSITLELDENKQAMSVRSVASQLGENSATETGEITGSGDITLNSRYLLEGLQAMDGDRVTIAFNGKLEPVVLKDPTNNDYLHIVMPLKS
jgi:DNA polymerase III subunit beta